MTVRIFHGDVLDVLKKLPSESVHMVCTSPPYFGLRDYGIPPSVWGGDPEHRHAWGKTGKRHRGGPNGDSAARAGRDKSAQDAVCDVQTGQFCECGAWLGCLGLEPTPELFVEHIVVVMREMRRVLRKDGICWVNLGDSYANDGKFGGETGGKQAYLDDNNRKRVGREKRVTGLKPKDLVLIPESVILALRADGWWVRSRLPWLKRNAMPESSGDRPTTAVEYVFMLSRSEHYFYDGEAVKVLSSPDSHARMGRAHGPHQPPGQDAHHGVCGTRPNTNKQKPVSGWDNGDGSHRDLLGRYPNRKPGVHPKSSPAGSGVKSNESFSAAIVDIVPNRSRRNSDWFFESWQGMLTDDEGMPLALIVNPQPFKGAHFATFPERLVEPMILAGTSERGCCPDCGAPWKRVTNKGAPNLAQQQACGGDANGEYHGEAVKEYAGTGAQNASEVKARILNGMRERVTVGWQPTCACYGTPPLPKYPDEPDEDAPASELKAYNIACGLITAERTRLLESWRQLKTVPCTAMDIFSGSGTVGLVSQRLQLDAILIEIGKQYVDMGERRIADDAPLLARVEVITA